MTQVDDVTDAMAPEAIAKQRAENRQIRLLLEAARMAALRHHPVSPEAQALVDHLMDITESFEINSKLKTRRRQAKHRITFRLALGALLADLLGHAFNVESDGFCHRAMHSGSYDDTYMTEDHFKWLRKTWTNMGLMEIRRGFQSMGSFFGGPLVVTRGMGARYRATAALMELAGTYLEVSPTTLKDHFQPNRNLGYAIVLKTRKDDDGYASRIDIDKSDPVVQSLAAELGRYNDFLHDHEFNLGLQPDFSRVFHYGDDPDYSFNKGGRLNDRALTSLTSLEREQRPHITIDGEATCEIDIKACQLTILYGITKTSMDQTHDPYDVRGISRNVVKKLVVAAIGLEGAPSRWPDGFKKEIEKLEKKPMPKNLTCRVVWQKVVQVHPVLHQLQKGVLGWAELQYNESRMLMATLTELMDTHGVVALPVHDCIIIPVSQKEISEDVFKRNFSEVCGLEPRVTVKCLEDEGFA
jgi:hypothetical protein